MKSILVKYGKEVLTPQEIKQAHVDFYTTLFSAEKSDPECQASLLNKINRFPADSDRVVCKGHIFLAELTLSLKTMNTNKAPGPDGLKTEFCRKFWKQLGPLLLEAINQSFLDGELPISMKSSMTRFPPSGF